ncbi:DsbC family protein [Moraxella oblonga]|uniref:DsbC family protein n=1 Tax=Moraxella oblonga TaxID=200413 RepID=UPI00082CBACB|nr:DsbC family protein [Moraxella oblonga]
MKKYLTALTLSLALTTSALANVDTATTNTINKVLTSNGMPSADAIKTTPVQGLLSVTSSKFLPILMTSDGKYVIEGEFEPNPSPAIAINPALMAQGKMGTPVSDAYKQALLANTKALKNMTPDTKFFYSSIRGLLWGVTGQSGVPFLMSADARYFINSDVLVVKNGKISGLDYEFEYAKNRHILATLDQNALTVYPAKNQKATVYVATDINCPYCKMFHAKIAEYNAKGITVKTIGYPVYDESPEPMRQIWCETDNAKRAMLLTSAMKGVRPKNQCQDSQNRLTANQKHAQALAIMATPMIYKDTGELFEGDFRANEFYQFLGVK